MKIYVKNPDTLKPRIKKLKQALNSLDGVSASLGLCRDLVAKSLNWDDWNELYLEHKKTGQFIGGDILFFGVWKEGECQKERCLKRLSTLIGENFGEVITKSEDKKSLAMTVWSQSKNVLQDMLKKKKIPKMSALDIPDNYLRDNVIIDADSQGNYDDFRQRALLPRLSKQGGLIFCSPHEAKETMRYFSERGIKHGVVTSSGYIDLISTEMLNDKAAIKHSITWQNDAGGVMLDTFRYILDLHAAGVMHHNERDNFHSWLTSKIKEGESVDDPKFNASNCLGLNEPSEAHINQIIKTLSEEQLEGAPISIAETLNMAYPLIMIAHIDDFLGRVTFGGLLAEIGIAKEKIFRREMSAPADKSPRLLITSYDQQINTLGVGMGCFFSSCANWSVVLPQDTRKRKEGEMPYFIKNASNIIYLAPKTIKRLLFRESVAEWFCVRNGNAPLINVIKGMASYGEDNGSIGSYVRPIPLKW